MTFCFLSGKYLRRRSRKKYSKMAAKTNPMQENIQICIYVWSVEAHKMDESWVKTSFIHYLHVVDSLGNGKVGKCRICNVDKTEKCGHNECNPAWNDSRWNGK